MLPASHGTQQPGSGLGAVRVADGHGRALPEPAAVRVVLTPLAGVEIRHWLLLCSVLPATGGRPLPLSWLLLSCGLAARRTNSTDGRLRCYSR